jgi:hypothetical protein
VPPKPTKVSAASDRDNVLFIPRRVRDDGRTKSAVDASDARGWAFPSRGRGVRERRDTKKKKKKKKKTRLDA